MGLTLPALRQISSQGGKESLELAWGRSGVAPVVETGISCKAAWTRILSSTSSTTLSLCTVTVGRGIRRRLTDGLPFLCWYGGAARVVRLQAAAVPAGSRRGTQRAAGSSPNRGPHSYRAHSTGPRGPPKSYFYLVVAQPPFSFARCFSDMVDRLPAITVAAAAPRAPIGLHHQCHSPVQSPPSVEGPVMATPTVAQIPVGC